MQLSGLLIEALSHLLSDASKKNTAGKKKKKKKKKEKKKEKKHNKENTDTLMIIGEFSRKLFILQALIKAQI